MAQGITTSIRLPPKLRAQLEKASHTLHRGKNWIIMQALQTYLNNLDHELLTAEAKRQSLLANKSDNKEDDWENDTDTTGWKI